MMECIIYNSLNSSKSISEILRYTLCDFPTHLVPEGAIQGFYHHCCSGFQLHTL